MSSKIYDVDLLSVALVREYLSRKGYKTTLNQFDKESKKRDNSIQNRRVLAEELGIIELVKKNKERGMEALKSFLEMMVYDFVSLKDISSKTNRIITPVSTRSSLSRPMSGERKNLSNSFEQSSLHNKTMPCLKSLQKDFIDIDFIPAANIHDIALNTSPKCLANVTLESEMNSSTTALSSRRKKLVHNVMMQNTHDKSIIKSFKKEPPEDYFSNSTNKSNAKRSPSFIETIRSNKIDSSSSSSLKQLNFPDTKKSGNNDLICADINHQRNDKSIEKSVNISSKPSDEIKITTDLTMNEVDVTSDDLNGLDVLDNYEDELTFRSEGISLDTAIKLKVLVLGSATIFFNTEWKQQGFKFCQHPLLKYGLVQEKGGPCGLLASVQAVVLKHLLFKTADQKITKGILSQPSPSQQKIALTNALVDIFQLISQNKSHVIVALPSLSSKFTPNRKYKNDNLTEKLQLFHLSPDRELKKFMSKNILYFMNTNGCILFLYSVVLTYGIENIRNTMDEANGTLIGSHGYCTQEMVNLLLTGKAVSNVFDGVVELDSGGEHMFILHGIKTKNDIGFLSLFEHYQSCQVGDNYKNPDYPIWVICSESHFSVLFSPVHLANEETTPFDLYYYDGLGRQDEEIRLTVSMKKSRQISPPRNIELIPPLEHCIRTKWSSATVSWNGSEPIL